MSTPSYAEALIQGEFLLETSQATDTPLDLTSLLKNRLRAYYNHKSDAVAESKVIDIPTLEEVQVRIAEESTSVITDIHKGLDIPDSSQDQRVGIRDLKKIRTLLSLAFKWGVEPLLNRVKHSWPVTANSRGSKSRIVELRDSTTDYVRLCDMVHTLISMVFPEGFQGRIAETHITSSILKMHASDLILPLIALGWLPRSLSSETIQPQDDLRPLAMRLLRLMTPAQAIMALGGILSTSPPPHVHKNCVFLLNKQLLRPDGVRGLCEAVFPGEEEAGGDEARLEKLKQVARTLTSVPPGIDASEYYQTTIPKTLQLLSDRASPAHRRAAAFTIYKILMPDDTNKDNSSASDVTLHMLHDPFIIPFADSLSREELEVKPQEALSTLATLLANTEPSSPFVSKLISPVIPSLYLLFFDLSTYKAADPQLKATVKAVIVTWGKIVDDDEVVRVLWSVLVGGRDTHWRFDLEGNLLQYKGPRDDATQKLVLPENGKVQEESGNIDLNLFDFYPDPKHFVTALKELNRGTIASRIFVQLLEGYQDIKRATDTDSMRALHLLQIVMQMQQQMFRDKSSPLLKNPEQILSFISQVLGTARTRPSKEDELDEADSDDEDADSEVVIGPDDEMLETTITLLLSILEDQNLQTTNYPLFNQIFSQLETFSQNSSSTIRPLAREARLVITARIAGETHSQLSTNPAEQDAQATYQEALKLLQDPILPVRAHGLMLLRDLLSSSNPESSKTTDALTPSILSIFIQSIQDDDSYIFLNAVQGLIVLANRVGENMVKSLMTNYVAGIGGLAMSTMSEQDVDVRTRIGEALSAVIKGSGTVLGKYVDLMLPLLMQLLRTHDCPIALRTSALSLVADCVATYPIAMLRYTSDLCWTLLDLLKLESNFHKAPVINAKSPPNSDKEKREEEDPTPAPESLDTNPTSKNAKLPPFRRAALHLLSMILREASRALYETNDMNVVVSIVPRGITRQMNSVLGMIALHDEDLRVKLMARENIEVLEELQQGLLGL